MTHDIQDLATIAPEPILALNNAHEKETSFLTPETYTHMVGNAFYARGLAPDRAFLIAFDEAGDYQSPNFLWFRDRYPSFAYIDRVITAASERGKGHARALYEDLFAAARKAGKPMVCCEVNSDPPNPGSDAFHAKLGFTPAGTAHLANGKTVRYLIRNL